MIHHGQGLTFLLEACYHFVSVHAQLNDLEGHAADHRLALFSHPHRAHAAFAELLQQLVTADHGS
jgi:hypothetical protein